MKILLVDARGIEPLMSSILVGYSHVPYRSGKHPVFGRPCRNRTHVSWFGAKSVTITINDLVEYVGIEPTDQGSRGYSPLQSPMLLILHIITGAEEENRTPKIKALDLACIPVPSQPHWKI